MDETQVIAQHRAAGRMFDAGGVTSFVRDEGDGPAVVCLHGVPSSSFLYRKVLPELAQRGLRGVAFDLPGLGLAARPENFDYSWTGLGRFATEAVDALGLDRFHLVVHDIGGPVGFELAAAMPERVQSLTVLNTLVDVASFTKAELDAYLGLLKREDGGRAFLQIMRNFETTAEKQALYRSTLHDVPYPVQVIWGEDDPALKVDTFGEAARQAARLDEIHRLPGKHFLEEDQAEPIAELVSAFVAD